MKVVIGVDVKRLRRFRCCWCARWLGPLRQKVCPWVKQNPYRMDMVGRGGRCEWWWNA